MKKILVLFVMALLAFMLSGCGVKKYCFIQDNEDRFIGPGGTEVKVFTGSIMIKKLECFGRVTVNQCDQSTEILYLGRAHPGNYIRLASRVGRQTPIVTEITYPEDSKLIDFQDAKIEVIEASDNWIRFKLISISTRGCNKVNNQDVK